MVNQDGRQSIGDNRPPATSQAGAAGESEPAAPGGPDYPMTIKPAGSSRRLLLVLLGLVVVAGGAWWFMLDEPAPPQAPPKVVAKVAPPTSQPPAPASSVSVTPPPAPAASGPVIATVTPAPPVPDVAKPSQPAAASGAWLVEAGPYRDSATAQAVVGKLREAGYEPQLRTQIQATPMTRLRLGSFPASEVAEALAYARGVAPEAFVLRSGASFTVYAGTFVNPRHVRTMTERLAAAGIRVEEEPVTVQRTVSLVQFGGFADQSAAAEAVARARQAGIAAKVIPPP